jgi:membrane-bound lytic murein transglycosylase D
MATWRGASTRAQSLILTLSLVLGGCQLTEPAPGDDAQGAPDSAEKAPPGGGSVVSRSEAGETDDRVGASQDEDLWKAMRRGFALDHEPDHPRVRSEIASLCRYPNYLVSMNERLKLYMPHVFKSVSERGLPTEIALLPIVESAMNPEAEALRGPTGLWQIIPATGDRLGLPRNAWFDGRRDPVMSTRAALDYLESGHARLKDWRLAIVAYNTGEGVVVRALAGRGSNADFWSLSLPYHGRRFVPRLLALATLVAEPDRCGFTLPEVRTREPFVTVDTGGVLSIPDTARALNVAEDDLYALNPGLNRALTPPDGPHRLNVPRPLASAARVWIAGLDSRPEADTGEQRITIRPGDSLSAIARRHGTDVPTLRALNGLRSDFLRAGATLAVPGHRKADRADARVAAKADGKPTSARSRVGRSETHVVRAGDTLWSLARAYRVSLQSLVASNKLTPQSVLRIGQRLRIPAG